MGSEIAGLKARAKPKEMAPKSLPDWRPCPQAPAPEDEGRFLLDHFLGRFCNPFYRINSEENLYDDTIDQTTGEPLSLEDFKAMVSGAQTPDELQRQLGAFLAERLVDDYAADFRSLAADASLAPSDLTRAFMEARRIRAADPFRPLLSPELDRHLLEVAAVRCGVEMPTSFVTSSGAASLEQLALARSKSEHEARFQERIENLRALRNLNQRMGPTSDNLTLIVGAGPAGLIRAISTVVQGLRTVVLELRPEDAPRRPQIVVTRSQTVIGLLEQLGVIDYLYKENRIFPLGLLRLEVSLADLELAFQAVLRAIAPDDSSLTMHYGARVVRIDQADGRAHVIASKSGGENLSFSPRLIVIADGRRSPTSALLGISRCGQFYSHTGIIAIFRAREGGLSLGGRWLGEMASKLNYAFHRYVSRKGAGLMAGTILQVPGHHYLGLDLARDEEMRLRAAVSRARELHSSAENVTQNGLTELLETDELRRLVRFWCRYGFEAIRTHPIGSAPPTGGRPISWLPLDMQFAGPIEVVSDRADSFCGHIGETFVMIEGDAQFTIHPGSAYGCTKALLSARLFDFLLRARRSGFDGVGARLADRVFLYNAELMARACDRITRMFKVTT